MTEICQFDSCTNPVYLRIKKQDPNNINGPEIVDRHYPFCDLHRCHEKAMCHQPRAIKLNGEPSRVCATQIAILNRARSVYKRNREDQQPIVKKQKQNESNEGSLKEDKKEGYLYLYHTREFRSTTRQNIYKYGFTKSTPEERFKNYEKGGECYFTQKVSDAAKAEREIKKIFKESHRLEFGLEYIQGNLKDILPHFHIVCQKYSFNPLV